MELVKCAKCGADILPAMVIYVKLYVIMMDTQAIAPVPPVLCPTCSPARGEAGSYYTLAAHFYDDLAAAKLKGQER